MGKGFFITGTDTDVGKTVISLALMAALQDANFTVSAMKPVAAGCTPSRDCNPQLVNDDAIKLQNQSSIHVPYEVLNPYALEQAIAPNIAAKMENVAIDLACIRKCYQTIQRQNDYTIVEGAGGWLVPLNQDLTMADIPLLLDTPVILIVGIRLGCLNHALLTMESILTKGAHLVGWVANHMTNDKEINRENILTLGEKFSVPLLGEIPRLNDVHPDKTKAYIANNFLSIL